MRSGVLLITLVGFLLLIGCNPLVSSPLTDAAFNPGILSNPSTLLGSVVPVYPNNGANWNDYVKRTNVGAGWTVFNQPDTACAGTELGYFNCIHGGEKRKVVVTGQSSCAGLTLTEALGAFDWICDASSGTATFYSKGLTSGKGLRDLVTASGFINNSVSVTLSGFTILQTTPGAWWTNLVGALPTNPNSANPPLSLSVPSKIYVLSASTTSSGYDIYGVNKVSIVALSGATLTYSGYTSGWCDGTGNLNIGGGSTSVLCTGGSNYLWIEGTFNGAAGTQAANTAFLTGTHFSRIRNSNFSEGSNINFDLDTSQSSFADSVSVYSGNNGLYISGGSNNLVMNSTAANNGTSGFVISNSTKNVLYADRSFNNGYGYYASSNENFFVDLLSSATGQIGYSLGYGGNQNTLLALTSVSDGFGVYIGQANTVNNNNTFVNSVNVNDSYGTITILHSNSNSFTDLMAVASTSSAVTLNTTNGNQFLGNFWIGGAGCSLTSSTGDLLSNSCMHGSGLSIAPLTGTDPSNSFVGKLSSNDLVNTSPGQINSEVAYADITDWVNFENAFRVFGVADNNPLFDFNQASRCGSGDCEIYDWSLRSSDTLLRENYGAFENGVACPSSADASVAAHVITDQQSTPNVFLSTAIEVMDPVLNPTGNFDGLCETGEVCIFTPNLGAYQGSGDYTTQNCAFTGGNGVTGVTMYGYPQNGN